MYSKPTEKIWFFFWIRANGTWLLHFALIFAGARLVWSHSNWFKTMCRSHLHSFSCIFLSFCSIFQVNSKNTSFRFISTEENEVSGKKHGMWENRAICPFVVCVKYDSVGRVWHPLHGHINVEFISLSTFCACYL